MQGTLNGGNTLIVGTPDTPAQQVFIGTSGIVSVTSTDFSGRGMGKGIGGYRGGAGTYSYI